MQSDLLNELAPQGASEFPKAWGNRMGDVKYWRKSLQAICQNHGLPWAEPVAGTLGSHAVFVVGEAVIKIYAMRWEVWFARETQALKALQEVPEAHSPRLIGMGDATPDKPEHPYLIMERLEGETLGEVWEILTPKERRRLGEDLGRAVRAIHSAALSPSPEFPTAPDFWTRLMRFRADACAEYLTFHEGLEPRLLAEVSSYLEENLGALETPEPLCLLNGDLHSDHILMRQEESGYRLSGILDFGDAEMGDPAYEWVALCLDAFQGDRETIDAFFGSYGIANPWEDAPLRRRKLYTLLHRFANPLELAETLAKPTDARSLDAFLNALWGA